MNGLALEVEIEPVKKNFDERTAQEEEARIWPEESGFDRVKAASNATTSVLEDAEERLLETEPSTLAGLTASGLCLPSKSAALVGVDFEQSPTPWARPIRCRVTPAFAPSCGGAPTIAIDDSHIKQSLSAGLT